MPTTRWTEEHDRLLSAAAPDVDVSAEDVERAWRRVAPRLTARPSRRRRRIAAATAIGAVVLGTSGLAVADHYSARTGRGAVDAEDLRLGGPGERLDPGAADYGEVVAQETADIPFPDAASRRFAVQEQLHDERFEVPGKGSVSTGAVRAWVADAALCAWSNQWAAATRDGDAAARAEAIRMIHQAPTWPAVTDLDPHPYLRWETVESVDENGKRTVEKLRDDSQFYYLAELGRAVEGTRPAVVAAVLAANNGYCRPSLVPDLPAADPLFGER